EAAAASAAAAQQEASGALARARQHAELARWELQQELDAAIQARLDVQAAEQRVCAELAEAQQRGAAAQQELAAKKG
ncbi:hypothetical protein ACXWOO_11850, partial [Streptococcus pyogenes]